MFILPKKETKMQVKNIFLYFFGPTRIDLPFTIENQRSHNSTENLFVVLVFFNFKNFIFL